MLDPKLLEILVCPKCRGELALREDPPALVCNNCRLVYEIRDGIPILLIDEAKALEIS
ncbi:MAG: Trm112 family protein [Gemmatimonas sp.]|nr:Trm112 family protein [Gemmatimonas sp.]